MSMYELNLILIFNFNDRSEGQENQDTGSKEILEEALEHINDNVDINIDVIITE
jgi:hypothetical protein